MKDCGGEVLGASNPGIARSNLKSRIKKSEQPATEHCGKGESPSGASPGGIGTLYVVATPIGNLEDITLRALRILKEVALVAAEDTRHTRKLLTHYGIGVPLISYYREKERERGLEVIGNLLAGRDVALVSDAGTPGISDPGAILVELARARGVQVVPVPGPSAVATLLGVAGPGFVPFLFLEFLPARTNQRRKLLASLATTPQALVFFESPRRVVAVLRDCLELLGDRPALLARELTKLYEEIRQENLSDLLERLAGRDSIKGELVVAIMGASREPAVAGPDLQALLSKYRQGTDLSLRDVAKQVAADLGMSRSEVYREALKLWKK